MYDVTSIKNYILFLKKQCGLMITLHPIKEEPLIFSSELINFNLHDNPYCIYIKSFPHVYHHCIERQNKVFDKCKGGSFCGCCFSGCMEFVYPISNGNETVGFISVSGYKTENATGYLSTTAEKYSIPIENLMKTYSALKTPPPKEEVDTLILPLCDMLELAYIKSATDHKVEEDFIDRAIRYIKQYHTYNITLDDLCSHFSCSRFYISHRFKKNTGRSFREYLNDIRIEDAKSLLAYSNLSVSEIAFSIGFNDSNYFSNVFKKQVGVSPIAYRRKLAQKDGGTIQNY